MTGACCVMFWIDAPPSKKNSRVWIRRGGRRHLVPSEECTFAEKMIRQTAREACAKAGWVMDATSAIQLSYTHFTIDERVLVTITKLDDRKIPACRSDVHGMLETIADALQDAAYVNDRQVQCGEFNRRSPEPPTKETK